MIMDFYYETDSFQYTANRQATVSLHERLICMEEIRNAVKTMGNNIKKDDEVYEKEFFSGDYLWELLFGDKQDKIPHDERKALMSLLQSATSINRLEYSAACKIVEDALIKKNVLVKVALISLWMTKISALHISDYGGWIDACRFYLYGIKESEEFASLAVFCFPNLYLHERVVESIKTLSAPLDDYLPEVIRHLSALNDYFIKAFQDNREQGLREVLQVFRAQTQISCTLEGNTERKPSFTFIFQDNEKTPISIVCEPHTKLESTGVQGDSRYRFDRIYFHQGRPDIEQGKILIGHIGKHL